MPGTYQESPSRNLAPRIFAVLALLVVGIVAIAIVAGSLGGSSSQTAPSTATTAPQKPSVKPYYVVRPGDSLSVIAARLGVSQARLERLNAGRLDPQNLQPQNCVDVKPNGCRQLSAKGG